MMTQLGGCLRRRAELRKWRQGRAVVLAIMCGIFIMSCASDKGNSAAYSDTGVAASDAGPTSGVFANYGGAVDTITCYAISGWVWNSANSSEKIDVDILIDNKVIGTTPADILRLDLQKMSPTPNFAFRLTIPQELKDGKRHSVGARVSGGNHELPVWEKIEASFTCKHQ